MTHTTLLFRSAFPGEGQVPGDFDDGDDEAPTADQREAVTKEMTNMLATHLQELKHKCKSRVRSCWQPQGGAPLLTTVLD